MALDRPGTVYLDSLGNRTGIDDPALYHAVELKRPRFWAGDSLDLGVRRGIFQRGFVGEELADAQGIADPLEGRAGKSRLQYAAVLSRHWA
jgi:hypothetical protein